jgi:hypothetical protein
MARTKSSGLQRNQVMWAGVILVEIGIALFFIWNCYQANGCQTDQCVPTGFAIGSTCLLVGAKVLGAFVGADAVVGWMISREPK